MIKIWLGQHWSVFILTLRRLLSAPITNFLSILVMGIALSLPAGMYILIENVQALSGNTATLPQMSLYLKHNTSQQGVDHIRQRLEENEHVVRFRFVSKDQALFQLQQDNGLNETIQSLAYNPLPDAFVVDTHDIRNISVETLDQLRMDMLAWPEIEYVQFDSDWVRRLDAILNFGRVFVLMLFTLLSAAIVAVMFNTIRLQILTKRDEIEVSKLIGATDSFIRRPFLYFGAIQGLAGGIMAWLIIVIALQIVNDALVDLALLYSLDIELQHLSVSDSFSLLIFATWLGWLGARVSVANHLWQIEP